MSSAELANPTAAKDTRNLPVQVSGGAPERAGRPYPFDATDPFRREDLSALLALTGDPALSIFLPTHGPWGRDATAAFRMAMATATRRTTRPIS